MKYSLTFSFLLLFCFVPKANTAEPPSQKLDLRFMNLNKIELDDAKAKNLVELDVSGNPITMLPASITNAVNLKVLRLSYCTQINMNSLALLVSKLPIEELELNYCNITYLPLELAGISTLRKVSLKGNQLVEIPWNLIYNGNLEYLDLANNRVDELARKEGSLPSLKYLDLSGNPCLNNLSTYSSLQLLQTLETLDCSGAHKLPTEWNLPQNLKELSLNDIRADFPKKVSGCDKLEKLSLRNNNYVDLEKELEAFVCPNLTNLLVSGRAVSKVPLSILNFKNLYVLDLSSEKLSAMPNDMSSLVQLKGVALKISDTNSVNVILKSLANNANLTELDLSGVRMKRLTDEISNLHSLQKLNLSGSGIRSFGEGIYKLAGLVEIDSRGNDLDASEIEKIVSAFPSARIYYDQLTPIATASFINKPFPQIEIKREGFTFYADKGTMITTQNGTKITVPANAMVDKMGKPVKQMVQLNFTPNFDPLTVFASGIPMSADSAGVKKDFASAGMFTLNATYGDNEPAFVKKGAKIKVDLVSDMPNQSYNYWYLDTVNRNWVKIGADTIRERSIIKKIPFKTLPRMPKDPSAGTFAKLEVKLFPNNKKKQLLFNIKADYVPLQGKKLDTLVYNPVEMKAYNRVTWYYVGEQPEKFHRIFDNKKSPFFNGWSAVKSRNLKLLYHKSISKDGVEMSIRPDKEKDCFLITFYTSVDSVSIPVIPETQFQNPEKESSADRKMYEEYYHTYKSNPTSRFERFSRYNELYSGYRKRMDEYNALSQAYHNKRVSTGDYQKLYDAYLAKEMAQMTNVLKQTGNAVRAMELTGFGTFNCDYFAGMENPIVCAPELKDEGDMKLHIRRITLVDLDVNSYISVSSSSAKLNPDRNYWLFGEAGGKKVGFAVVSAGDLKAGKKVQMKLVNGNNIDELRSSMMAKK